VPLGSTALSWLALAALLVAIVALLLALSAFARASRDRGRLQRTPRRLPGIRRRPDRPLSAEEMSAEIEALHTDAATALRHVAVVRYDAFGDMGGHLSWSLALLDDGGDGVVVTSIHGRSDSRTYAKNVSGWQATQQLSPEEEEAISFARSPQ
jgi:Protein of unknown function (DUF4446)